MATATSFLTTVNGKYEERSIDTTALQDTFNSEASEALAVGDLVNCFDDAGTSKIRKADAALGRPVHGFVKQVYTIGQSAQVFKGGIIADTGLSEGDCLFLSATTPGAYSQTAPTKTNTYINQIVGFAATATDACIKIEDDYVTFNI